VRIRGKPRGIASYLFSGIISSNSLRVTNAIARGLDETALHGLQRKRRHLSLGPVASTSSASGYG